MGKGAELRQITEVGMIGGQKDRKTKIQAWRERPGHLRGGSDADCGEGVGGWKNRGGVTPEAEGRLTTENFNFAPQGILADGVIFISAYYFLEALILRTLSPVSSI